MAQNGLNVKGFQDSNGNVLVPLSIIDGQYLIRSGNTIVSGTPVTYVDRGNPASPDFTSFIIDSAWHILDLSSIIPAGTIAVVLRIGGTNSLINKIFKVTKVDNSNGINCLQVTSQAGGSYFPAIGTVGVNSNRQIQYYVLNSGTWAYLDLIVCGWFI